METCNINELLKSLLVTFKFHNKGSVSKTLKKDEVQVMSNDDCFEWLSFNTSLKRNLNSTFR